VKTALRLKECVDEHVATKTEWEDERIHRELSSP
jgi:hypothetical protein